MADDPKHINPEDVGSWDGDTFVLHEPVINANGEIRRITISKDATFADGITRDDVVHAMLNPVARIPLDE